MLTDSKIKLILSHEVSFSTAHAGGKGGQNVNKVETKVILTFSVTESFYLTSIEKDFILLKSKKLTKEGELKFSSDKYRTQLQNKEEVVLKFKNYLLKLFTPIKKRIATAPTRSSKLKKQKEKRSLKLKKENRRKPDF